MSDTVKIRIGSEFYGQGFAQGEAAFGRLDSKAQDFVDTLRMGVGIDLGGRIVQSLAQVPAILEEALARGVAFNVEIAGSETAIANVIAQFQGLNKEAAKNEAAKAIAQIKILEPEAAGGMKDLVGGFVATNAAAAGVGLSIKQNVELVGIFANALANTNQPIEQLGQEMRSILTGNIGPDSQLARTLGITNTDIQQAKEAGEVYDFLKKKIGSLGEAGDTWRVRWSTLNSAIDKSLGELSKPVFDELFASLKRLSDELANPAVVADLRQLGFEVANVVHGGEALLEWALRNSSALNVVAHSAVTLGAALAAMGITRIALGLGAFVGSLLPAKVAMDGLSISTVRSAAVIEAECAALAAETAALAANTAAQGVNAGARAAGAAGAVAGTGVGSAAAGAAKGGLGAGLAASGIAIGSAIYAYRVQIANQELSSAQANDALVDSLSKQREQLEAQVKAATDAEAKATARKAIEEQIRDLKNEMNRLDEDGAAIARRGVFNLESLLKRFDRYAGSAPLNAKPDEASINREFEATNKRADLEREIRVAAMNPKQLLDQNQGRIGELRAVLADQLQRGGARVGAGFAAPEAAAAVEKSTFKNEAKAELLTMLKELVGLEKEVAETRKQSGAALDENMGQLGEQFKAEQKRKSERSAMLADMTDELGIQKALVSGNEAQAHQIERQRDLRKKLLEIDQSELTPAEQAQAKALATQTSEMERQKTLREDAKKMEAARDQLAVDTARPGSTREKRAKLEQALHSKRQELTDAGFEGSALEDGMSAYERAQRRGLHIMGGPTRHGLGETMDGLNHLGNRPGSIGTGMSGDFAKAFHRKPLGELIATRPPNAPGVATEDGAGGSAAGGGEALGKAGGELNDMAAKVKAASAQMIEAAKSLKESSAENLTKTAEALSSAAEALRRHDAEIDTIKSRIISMQA